MTVDARDAVLVRMTTARAPWLMAVLIGLALSIFACSTEPAPVSQEADAAPELVVATAAAPTKVPVSPVTPQPTQTPEPTVTSIPPTPTPHPTATPVPPESPAATPVVHPAAVQNLRTVNVSEDSITLQWNPPENADAVPIDRYEVTRDVSLAPDEHKFVLETTFTDVGLEAGAEHKYRVRAIGAGGTQGTEVGIEESTLKPPTPEPTRTPEPTMTPIPSTPPALPTATPVPADSPTVTSLPHPGAVQNLRTAIVSEESITLQWDPPENASAVPVDRYEVTRDVSLGPDEQYFVLETTFTDMGLRSDTGYKYRVRAIGAGGTEGPEVGIEESTLRPPTLTPSQTPEPTLTSIPSTSTPLPTATQPPTPTATPAPTGTPIPSTPTPIPTPSSTAMWRGLAVADEDRCSPYDSDDYRYSQSVEARIVADMGGIIYGPYTGRWFSTTRETDIEHIVARSEVHDSGLCAADGGTRRRFASDLLNLTLASESVNRHQKIAKDAAEWLPDLNQCWFADRVIRVRRKYGLTIDERETEALDSVLSGCSSFEMVVVPADQASPTPTPASTSGSESGVDALAMWDDNGNGKISCAEARNHDIAPVPRDHPAYPYMDDRNDDGVVC